MSKIIKADPDQVVEAVVVLYKGSWDSHDLDWHKTRIRTALEQFVVEDDNELNEHTFMVRAEQLPCSRCGRPLKEHSKKSKICPDMKGGDNG